MRRSGVAWCDFAVNFYTWDCTRVSPGCKHCYALVFAERLGKSVTGRPRWREKAVMEFQCLPPGSTVFVNNMSDTYHEAAPQAWIHRIHNLALTRPDLMMLILTKRVERALGLSPFLAWPENLLMGTSVENADYLWRIDYLRRIPAAGRFVSFGPLLGSVGEPNLDGIAWAITEGESGPDGTRRYFDKAWARSVRDACRKHGAAFFHKQGSGRFPGQDRLLDGRLWEEFPALITEHKARWATALADDLSALPGPSPRPVQLALW